MGENYYALAISIIKGLPPEQSFELLSTGRVKQKCNPDETEDLVKLKDQGMTYEEVAEIFGISADTAYRRIYRAKRRLQ